MTYRGLELNHDKFGPEPALPLTAKMEDTRTLRNDLTVIAELLRKYRHCGQARVVEEVLATLETSAPTLSDKSRTPRVIAVQHC